MADDLAELCALFAVALELEYVTPDTDFFAAGGHSLSALTLAMSVEKTFRVRVRARDIFEYATPELLNAGLAGLDAVIPEPEPDLARPPDTTRWPGQPLAPTMRWLWLERQRDDIAPGAYTVPCLLAGEGRVDVARLRTSIESLAVGHPTLNSIFYETQGVPRTEVCQRPITLEVMDLRTWKGTENEFRALVYDHVEIPFELSAGPLLRPTLFLRDGGAWLLLLVADHLICDGTSLQILAADIVRAYSGDGPAPVAGDVARWPEEGSQAREAAIEHWRARLTPPPAPLPLPVLGPRLGSAGATEVVTREISPRTIAGLREHAGRSHAGSFAPLAAAVARAIGAITGSEDICLGTAVDRRGALGLARAVGSYVSTVPLRLTVPAHVAARDLVSHVGARTLDALDHSGVTFAELVAELNPARVPGRMPFFDVWVGLYPYIEAESAGSDGIALRGGPIPLRQGVFELAFEFVENSSGLRMVLQYDTSRYDRDTIERLAQRVATDLDWIAAGLPAASEERDPQQTRHDLFQGFRLGADLSE